MDFVLMYYLTGDIYVKSYEVSCTKYLTLKHNKKECTKDSYQKHPTILNNKQVTKSHEKTHLFNSFLLPLVNEIINIQCLQNIHFTKSDIKHHPNFRSQPKYFMSLGIARLLELEGNNI